MKIHIKILVAALFVFLTSNNLFAAQKQTSNIMVLFSGNLYGETDPCG